MTSANHQPQIKFAPAAPPRSVAKAARLCSSLGWAATPFDQPQMGTDTALGRRLGMCRLALAVGETGRGFGRGLGCFTVVPHEDLTGAFNSSGPFFHFRTQPRRQAVRYVLEDHFINSVSVAPTLSDNGGQSLGYRGQRHERHDG